MMGMTIFGPASPIVRVDMEAEAITLAKDAEFGLASCVRAYDIARGIARDTGCIGEDGRVNEIRGIRMKAGGIIGEFAGSDDPRAGEIE